jgi:hypothetical protein
MIALGTLLVVAGALRLAASATLSDSHESRAAWYLLLAGAFTVVTQV